MWFLLVKSKSNQLHFVVLEEISTMDLFLYLFFVFGLILIYLNQLKFYCYLIFAFCLIFVSLFIYSYVYIYMRVYMHVYMGTEEDCCCGQIFW